jgi:SAM-dependent methyltransferase
MLADVPEGRTVVDIPVGTGRYAEYYAARKLLVFGLDTSQDMLDIAKKAFEEHGVPSQFDLHDILEPLPKVYDVAVCTRLVNHFTLDETRLAVKNLLDSATIVILGLREPKQPTEKNWHHLSDVLPPNAKETHRVVMSDGEASRYLMVRIASVD